MNLSKKKELAARTLKVGKGRIIFNTARLDEIKEAITKQDIRDLLQNKAMVIREVKGRRTRVKRNTRRKQGSIKQKPKKSKREYIIITRKLRRYLAAQRKKSLLTQEDYHLLRKEVRVKNFKSLAQLKEKIAGVKK